MELVHSPRSAFTTTDFRNTGEKDSRSVPLTEWRNKSITELVADLWRSEANDALEATFNNGTSEEKANACIVLLQYCQNDALSELSRSVSKILLLKFLEATGFASQSNLPCFARSDDPNQILSHALREFLFSDFSDISGFFCMNWETTNAKVKPLRRRIGEVYGYLKKHDVHIYQQFLNEVIAALDQPSALGVWNACKLLAGPGETEPIYIPGLTQNLRLLAFTRPDQKPPLSVYEFMQKAADQPTCPAAVFWLGCNAEKDSLAQVEYYNQAALAGDKRAIDALNDMAARFKEFGHIEPLPDIYHPNAVMTHEGWAEQVNAIVIKIKKEIMFHQVALPVFHEQNKSMAGFSRLTFKERMEEGKKLLGYGSTYGVMTWDGVMILEGLSELTDHPLAVKASQILNAWLDRNGNRIVRIMDYIRPTTQGACTAGSREQRLCSAHMNSFCEHVRVLKKSNKAEKALKLVHKLIDMTMSKVLFHNANGSQIYQALLSAEIIDDQNTIEEIKIHQSRSESKPLASDKYTLQCLTKAADTPGRNAVAAYLLVVVWDPNVKEMNADGVQRVLHYFKKAAVAFDKTKKKVEWIEKEAKRRFEKAKTTSDKLEALFLYEWAGKAGHNEAYFQFLKLAAEVQYTPNAAFDLGKVYLTGELSPYPKQDIDKAQTLLERAVESTCAPAAFLLAHHFSVKTPDQPKFSLPFYMLHTSNEEKAKEFLKKGVELIIKQQKNLSEALEQLHPTFADDIFELSELYRTKSKNNEAADTLLNWAVENGSVAAADKKFALLNLRMKGELPQNQAPSSTVEVKAEKGPVLTHENDDTRDLYDRGMSLIRGEKEKRNLLAGLNLLKKAADQGDKKALAELEDTTPNSPFFSAFYDELKKVQNPPELAISDQV